MDPRHYSTPASVVHRCLDSEGEPIWKCIERIIDHRLDAIELHDSFHGCRNGRGTGTAIIKAKLAQQLAYLELKPFYRFFLDFRKAFDALDWERSILLLELFGWWILAQHHHGVLSYWVLWRGLSGRPLCHLGRPSVRQALQ
jgi:hypothetical protein